MEIFIDNRQQTHKVDLSQLEQFAQNILHYLKCEERCELSIALVDDAEMQQLNREYRGIDRTTDVLSFAQQETIEPQLVQPHFDDDAMFPLLLGDVIISVETTEKQAKEHETTFEHEFYFLLIHGILHLLGYDHQKAAESRAMKRLEQEVFAALVRGD